MNFEGIKRTKGMRVRIRTKSGDTFVGWQSQQDLEGDGTTTLAINGSTEVKIDNDSIESIQVLEQNED